MAKIVGIVLFSVVVWVGIEVSAYGMGGAFGGIFARLGLAEAPPEPAAAPSDGVPDHYLVRPQSTARRAADRVQDAYDTHYGERFEAQLGEAAPAEE